jgi:imidazolonepropionase-like amidohydrolase
MNGGAELIAGTDAGIPGVPHGAYADGLIALAFHGVPPDAVMRAATTGAARALGLDDARGGGGAAPVGALLPGYTADIVVLEDDPLRDIEAVAQVTAVFRAGQLVSFT